MKIAIEARALSARGGGVKTYTEQLIQHLSMKKECELSVIYDDKKHLGMFGEQVNEKAITRKSDIWLSRWLNKQVLGYLEELGPDMVHYTKAAVPRKKVLPTVVTIYDVIPILFPSSQKLTRRYYWPRALKNAAKNSDHILTISEASKKDVVKMLQVPEEKVTVTKLAVDTNRFKLRSREECEGVMRVHKINKPFILYIGALEPRKNVPLLIRAYGRAASEVKQQLVIAGSKDSDFANVREEISRQKLDDKVKVLGFVEDQDLSALYAAADLFVWPSAYEGWGFPPQEAMACGTPVIVSNGGALPEVVGDAGAIVKFATNNLKERTRDKEFEEKLAEKIKEVLGNEEKQKEMTIKGLERVKSMTWDKVAEETVRVYELVVSSLSNPS